MTFSVSLFGYRPPPRPLTPWTQARIDEAPGSSQAPAIDGPWQELETQPLVPLDVDPREPMVRDFQTSLATVADGWYRIAFLDAVGAETFSRPERNLPADSLPPTPSDVRARSPLLRQRYPIDSANELDLDAVIEDASAVVASLTGRRIPPVDVGEEVPAGLVGIAIRATARMAELMDTEASAKEADAAARGRRLRGFSAGPYSEQYFAPDDLTGRGRQGRPAMSVDPQLDRLLWTLATEDARDEFIARATGVQPAAGAVTAFDYRRMGGGLFSGSRLGRGPDGW